MLKVENSKLPFTPHGFEDPSITETLQSFRALALRQRSLILFIFLFVIASGAVFFFTTPPKYTAAALLIIDSKKSQPFQQQSPMGIDLPLDSGTVDSQVEILKSENIAFTVIQELRLIDEEEFVGAGGGLPGVVIAAPAAIFQSAPKSEYELTRQALETFQNGLVVKRIGLSHVIEISFQSTSPERAARIANAIAEAYLVEALEAKYQASRRASTWLQDRLNELRGQASSAERAVVDFRIANNIVDTGGRLSYEQQLSELNSALIATRSQKAEAQARLDRIDVILKSENTDLLFNDMATVADSLKNDVVTRLRQQYLDFRGRESDLAAKYGSGHLAAVNLRNQMREIRRSISEELRRTAESYRSDYEIAKSREENVQQALNEIVSQSNSTNRAQVTLRELDSAAQNYRGLADNFLQNYMMSLQQQSFPLTDSRLITSASIPLKPSFPKLWKVLLASMIGGGGLAFGLAAMRDMLDRVFRTSRQIPELLGAECIAVLPAIGAKQSKISQWRLFKKDASTSVSQKGSTKQTVGAMRDTRIQYSDPVLSHVSDAPLSRFSEGIRSIKMALQLRTLSHGNCNVIGITSSLPNEGKSTIATALATVMAQAGARTVLVDCDIRNPALTRALAPNATAGLLEVALGGATPESVIWTDPITHLSFMPAVVTTHLLNSSEILSSDKIQNLFNKLQQQFDHVVVNLSPLAPLVDVRGTSKLIHAYVLVVEWGRTKTDVVEHALREAPEIYAKLVGVVLNKTDVSTLARHESDQGAYYRNKYYSRYGYTE
jgi:succinoglycan biosynthesis transport protein ExoP